MFFGHGTTLSVLGSPDHSRARLVKRREENERAKEKAKDDPKGPEEHSLVMGKRKIPNGGKKRTQCGGPRKERQEGLVKRQRRSSEGWFSPVPSR